MTLDELEAIAKLADHETKVLGDCARQTCPWFDKASINAHGIDGPDADHIAAFDPPTVLALIAVARAAKAAEAVLARIDTLRHITPEFVELNALRAALTLLEARDADHRP